MSLRSDWRCSLVLRARNATCTALLRTRAQDSSLRGVSQKVAEVTFYYFRVKLLIGFEGRAPRTIWSHSLRIRTPTIAVIDGRSIDPGKAPSPQSRFVLRQSRITTIFFSGSSSRYRAGNP